MAEAQFGSNVDPLLPTNERYAQFKKQQAQAMQQHQAYSQQLEQKQQVVQQRKGDLDIAAKLLQILDSRVPKPARQFLSKELAQHVGADPKSEQVKGVTQMLTGLDPDSLQGLRSTFASQLDKAPPGEITNTVHGILTGQVPMSDFIQQVGAGGGAAGEEQQQPQVAGQVIRNKDQVPTTGWDASTEPTGGGEAPAPEPITSTENIGEVGPMNGGAQPAPFQSGAPGEISSFEGQRTIPPAEQQASPTIVGALGLDSKQSYRNKDLMQGGFRVPFDAKEQDKLAEDVNNRTAGLAATVHDASKMVDIFEGHPETLGTVGGVASTIQGIVQQTQGALNLINPAIQDQTDPYSGEVQSLSKQVGEKIAKLHSIDVTANNAAQLQSMALGLAYKMAIANDIPGNRLTNVIIEQNLRQIGSSNSPQQFKSVLANTLDSTTREMNDIMRRKIGVSGTDVMVRQMTDADLQGAVQRVQKDTELLKNDPNNVHLIPREMRQSMLDELIRRKTGESKSPTITPSSPTLEEERKTLGGAEMQKKQRELDKSDQTLRLEQERMDMARQTQERADTREERVTKSQEAGARLAREQFEFSRAEHEKDNAFQREQFEYRKSQDRKAEDERRSAKIAAAFQHFGAAIAGRSGGGGSVGVPSLGGGQDVSAFRMAPPPQRVPPRVK
jgi:hypothetical protein